MLSSPTNVFSRDILKWMYFFGFPSLLVVFLSGLKLNASWAEMVAALAASLIAFAFAADAFHHFWEVRKYRANSGRIDQAVLPWIRFLLSVFVLLPWFPLVVILIQILDALQSPLPVFGMAIIALLLVSLAAFLGIFGFAPRIFWHREATSGRGERI